MTRRLQTVAQPDPMVVPKLPYCSTDGNHGGRIRLRALTRVIGLYNDHSGSVRTGRYPPQSLAEDGFAPGP